MLKIKKGRYGARLDPMTAKVVAFMVVDQAMENQGLEYELTSGAEGEHMPGSLHFVFLAWDWTVRTRSPLRTQLDKMVADVKDRLGDDFDVVWKAKAKRLHVEFQPKKSFGRL